MAKISYKLDTRRPLADGRYPLKIAISHRGDTALVSTDYSFTEKEWDASLVSLEGNRRMALRERLISEYKTKMETALHLLSAEEDIAEMKASDIKKRILGWIRDGVFEEDDEKERRLFLPYLRSEMESKETKGTRLVYRETLRLIQRYELESERDPEALRFDDITPAWLLSFDRWMSPTNGVNTRSKNMRNIRAVFNAAIDEGMKVDYPFSKSSSRRGGAANDGRRKFRIVSNLMTAKRSLTIEQLRALRDYPCAKHQEQYRDMFMLMFYLIGINSVDLLTARPEQLTRDGRLEYRRQKTHRFYSIKVQPEAMEIINRYRGKKYLLSPCDRNTSYTYYLRRMNEQLQRIGITYHTRERHTGEPLFPDLTTYWARHTWSSIAANIGVYKDIVGKAMGHSWALDTVTDIYINMDPKLIDEGNRAVLDAIK